MQFLHIIDAAMTPGINCEYVDAFITQQLIKLPLFDPIARTTYICLAVLECHGTSAKHSRTQAYLAVMEKTES